MAYLFLDLLHLTWLTEKSLVNILLNKRASEVSLNECLFYPCLFLETLLDFPSLIPRPLTFQYFHFTLRFMYLGSTVFAKGLPGGSVGKESSCNAGDAGDTGLISGLGRPTGRGHGNLLQSPCLESPMDGGAWRVIIHGVAKIWTQLNWRSAHTHTHICNQFWFICFIAFVFIKPYFLYTLSFHAALP